MDVDTVIATNLEFVLQTREQVLAYLEAMPPRDRTEVSSDWLAMLDLAEQASPWIHGYSIRHRYNGDEVGRRGFKGPPDKQGMVEIAYGIAPEHQGRGYATEAVVALTGFVLEKQLAAIVRAHTLPAESASTSVLRKCGYQFAGEVVDPEDGRVWRWEFPGHTEG